MESLDCFVSIAPGGSEANAGAGWQTVPLEETLRSETEYCFLLDGKQIAETSGRLNYSVCEASNDETNSSTFDSQYVSIKASEDYCGLKEVRLSIHQLEDQTKCSENAVYKSATKVPMDSGPFLGPGDDECLPLFQQVRAFVKGAKLSCTALLSGDGKPFFRGWSSLLQRSFSFKSSESSSDDESFCKKGNSYGILRMASAPMPSPIVCSIGIGETVKASPLLARDPASRADALPLAHYRPTDGLVWKDGEVKTGQSTASAKSPVHSNCKKPPKPPRHPGRSASLDSATYASQRVSKINRVRAAAKRKSRGAPNGAASTGLSPLVALVLTIGFGILMVFQGLFVQTNASYGITTDSDLTNVAANSRTSLSAQEADSLDRHPIDAILPASSNVDVSYSDASLRGSVEKSMTDLPWSRSSLISQVKSLTG